MLAVLCESKTVIYMGGMLCTRRRDLSLDQSATFTRTKTQGRFEARENQAFHGDDESGTASELDATRRRKGKSSMSPQEPPGDPVNWTWDIGPNTPTPEATPKSVLHGQRGEDGVHHYTLRPDGKAPGGVWEKKNLRASPPRKIRWKKGELIGAGAFGRVYMGMNVDSGELIAVKQVLVAKNNPDKLKAQEQIRELEEEVALLKNLSHENIVRYIGTDREEEALNIFLEFVPGGSIASLLGKFGAFSEKVVRVYTRQLLVGLKYLHDHHIMHRDIKGANILVDNKGCIKLADFGASKKLQDLATVSEGYKTMKGTPYWMAPEVIKGTGHGRPADIWSVGCTVIEMATGQAPWSQFQNPVSAIYHIASAQTGPPIPDTLSLEGQDFLRKCLQRDQRERPAVSVLLQHPFVANPMPQSLGSTVNTSFMQSIDPHQASMSRSSGLPTTWESSNSLTDSMDDSCLPRGFLSAATTMNTGTRPDFGRQGLDENGLMRAHADRPTDPTFGGLQPSLPASNQFGGKVPSRSASRVFLESRGTDTSIAGEQAGMSGRAVLSTVNGNSQRQWGLQEKPSTGPVNDGPWPTDMGLSLRSYNPMQEPSFVGPGFGLDWSQMARGNAAAVAEPSRMVIDDHNAHQGNNMHHTGSIPETASHGSGFDQPSSGTAMWHEGHPGADVEDEVTEESILRYLNSKAVEVNRLQEEFQHHEPAVGPFPNPSHASPTFARENGHGPAHFERQVLGSSRSPSHQAVSSPGTAVLGPLGTALRSSRESEASVGTEWRRSVPSPSPVPSDSPRGVFDVISPQDMSMDPVRASAREQQWQLELQQELAKQREELHRSVPRVSKEGGSPFHLGRLKSPAASETSDALR